MTTRKKAAPKTAPAAQKDEHRVAPEVEPSATAKVEPPDVVVDVRRDGPQFTVTCTRCGDQQRFVDENMASAAAAKHEADVHG